MKIDKLEKITSYEFTTIDFNSILRETEEFFTEYFNGAVSVRSNITYSLGTDLALEGLAFFMRKFFGFIFRQQMITVSVENLDGDMLMQISWRDGPSLSETEMRELRAIASLSGFGSEFYERGVTLHFYRKALNLLSLYAVSAAALRDSYRRAFI